MRGHAGSEDLAHVPLGDWRRLADGQDGPRVAQGLLAIAAVPGACAGRRSGADRGVAGRCCRCR